MSLEIEQIMCPKVLEMNAICQHHMDAMCHFQMASICLGE
jgi:hypothetical protein